MSELFETIEKEKYKVMVTDTGLVSSLVAAAVARLGHKVLHVDRDRTYGADWKTHHLLPLIGWTLSPKSVRKNEAKVIPREEEIVLNLDYHRASWRNIEAEFSVFGDPTRFKQAFCQWIENRKADDESVDKLLGDIQSIMEQVKSNDNTVEVEEFVSKRKISNRLLNQLDNAFTVDLCPRMLLARGSMVELLIRSNVSRYLEFRSVDRILAPVRENENEAYQIKPMPLNRSDVFQSNVLSLIEKRLLMRFLQACHESSKSSNQSAIADQNELDQSFDDFLRIKHKFTIKLIDIVRNSLLMSEEPVKAGEAIEKIVKIIQSMGRFSDRPYLWCAYGADDLLQSFCRYAAIYEADYCLGVATRSLLAAKQDDHHLVVQRVITDQFVASVEHVVTSFAIPELVENEDTTRPTLISRAVICSTQSLLPSDRANNSSLLYLPSSYTGHCEVFVFETNSVAGTVADGLYLQYFWCDGSSHRTAKQDLESTIAKIFAPTNQDPVWCVYYQQECHSPQARLPSNVHFVRSPINELDFEDACQQAQMIFKQILPDETFFPETKEPGDHAQSEVDDQEEGDKKDEMPMD